MDQRAAVLRCIRFTAIGLFTVLALAGQASAANTPASFLTARFKSHFDFGVEAPIAWMQDTRANNGCNWDARVQYLSGGVHYSGSVLQDPWFFNPAWNNGGHYITGYIDECRTVNCAAWFTWYFLAQSDPANYSPGPAQATPVNAANAQTMNGYFTLVKKVFQECGSAGNLDWPVVFHVEPDEWNHLLLTTRVGNAFNPANVVIKVGSSGMADVASYPDNLVGYADALKHLRDLYAPQNVLLVCNPSAWDPDNTMSGTQMGGYMSTCCGGWEAAVLETGDRDKGLGGQLPPYTDQSGVLGTFDRHIQWIADFKAASNLPVFVWQAAEGNTYFKTCNNSDGHYTDDLIQTLLEGYPNNNTILRYARAGCLGWMFNAGQGGSTHFYDSKGDGVTNPATAPGTLGYASTYADDDGGYARLRVGSYFTTPYALGSTPPAPVVVDTISLLAANDASASFRVKLGAAPAGATSVAVTRLSGDADIAVSTATVAFTTSNWNAYQTVTLAIGPNADTTFGSAIIRCAATGYSSAYVTATEPLDGGFAAVPATHKACGFGSAFGAVLLPLPLLLLRRSRPKRG